MATSLAAIPTGSVSQGHLVHGRLSSATATAVANQSSVSHSGRRIGLSHPGQLGSSFLAPLLPQRSRITELSSSANLRIRKNGSSIPAVRARTTKAKTYETEVDKPLGLTFGPKSGSGGGVVVTGATGNGSKAGIKVGDQVLYTSSFFGDELWPADSVAFTRTAVNAQSNSVYFVLTRGVSDTNVRKLPKRPLPPRFGRKLTEAQKARATHICLDCGYIYTLSKPFDEQPEDFLCPQCQAPKKRFAGYDPETGRATGGGTPISVILAILASVAAIGALAFFGLQ